MQRIVIPTTKDKYYRQLLEFLRPIKPFSSLNNKDLDAFSSIINEYMGLIGLNHEQRCNLIFSQDVRYKIADNNNMSKAAFNNSISKFKKLGLIVDKGMLDKKFMIQMRPSNKLEIIFRWKEEK